MPEIIKNEEITDSLKQYLTLNYDIFRLQATERASVFGSSFISSVFIGVSAFLFLFTLSIGVGFYLSALMDNTYSGFVIVAGCYLLLAIILFIGRKRMIQAPIRDKIIQKLLNTK